MTPLKKFATQIRIEQIKCIKHRGFGHIGGALSATDLIAALYGGIMRIDPKNPEWQDRDRFVCSKGHAGPALYAALALKGYFPFDWLLTLNRPGTKLPSHCDMNLTPGIDMTTGSLGQGASTAAGMALALKNSKSDARVYLLLGDGECNEGQVWEMVMFAAAKKINNLIAFVDYNHKQLDGRTEDIIDLGDLKSKFESFGWFTQSVDGNDPDVIFEAINKAKDEQGDRPAMIILNTIKGAGVPSIEKMEFNHHINMSPEFSDEAIAHLEKLFEEV
jgi:transketolase